MKHKLRLFGEQTMLVLAIFISFLLLFDKKLVLPAWLQSVGRLHTVLLHFPIVLLLLSIITELIRIRTRTTEAVVALFSGAVLLAGTVLGGLTVVLGLLLSREADYGGAILIWHKWTGAFVFFISFAIYWSRNRSWWRLPASIIGSLTLLIAVMLSGHFGATITHGENFILQPIAGEVAQPPVPFAEAIVFRDLIQPILIRKCSACHNPHKLKGEMSLTDSSGLIRGGKSGKLYIPGNTAISLLLERVHLSMDEEKHMPPAAKPQLSAAEIQLLSLWIKEDASFSQKLIDLPAEDSLRLLGTVILHPSTDSSLLFEFEAADDNTISKLNTEYTTVKPVSQGSPALDVSLYNPEVYNVKQLLGLEKIKKQIVSLSLNKLPVRDKDLKVIAGFENLHRLDLNFSEISTEGLAALEPLKHLKTLLLSGTKLKMAGLAQELRKFANLKTIAVWNTSLSAGEISDLATQLRQISFIEGFRENATAILKLNVPQMKNETPIFSKELLVRLSHPIRGVTIRYTTDGSEPDSLHSPVFENNTVIGKNTTIRAKAYKPGWQTSDLAIFEYFKNSYLPDSTSLLLPLHNVHQAEGAQTFFNKKLGVIGANNPAWANYWAGVKENDLGLACFFHQPILLKSVGLHYMVEEATGIFPPAALEIWGGINEQELKLLATIKPPLPKKGDKPSLKIAEGFFKPVSVSCLRIIAKPHAQKKDKHLLLVDEMFLN